MEDQWPDDRRVLVEIVRRVEVEGERFPNLSAVYAGLDLADQRGDRAMHRLVENGWLRGKRDFSGWTNLAATERGLRETGAYPTAEQLTDRLIAAFETAAEDEPEPERKGKLRSMLAAVGGPGRDIAVDVMSGVITKSMGLG